MFERILRRASRCGALIALGAVLFGGLVQPGSAQHTDGGIVVVTVERILRESQIGRELRQAEQSLATRLQARVDAAKAALEAEEVELTKLRVDLTGEEFEERATEFDRRIRLVRREAQERANVLQRAFQEARAALVAALPPVLEKLRVESGAAIVVSADQVLAARPGIDLTGRAIELLDAEGAIVTIPEFDLSAPLIPPSDIASPQQTEGQ